MVDRRALLWFLDLTLAISRPLFLLPLFIPGGTPLARQLTTTGLWTLAMWGPGTAAILTTVLVQKKPLGNLKLNHLGPKRYYLWAWFLPPVLTIAGGLLTLSFGIAKLDTQFTTIRDAMASSAAGRPMPAG